MYALSGNGLRLEQVAATGLIANPNKENLNEFSPQPGQYLVELQEDDAAQHLADQLTAALGQTITVRRFKAWHLPNAEAVLKNGLLCNPNSGRILTAA